MTVPRLRVSARMREIMSYDKLAGAVPRALILESRYWLDDACANAARSLGWELKTVPTAAEGLLPRDCIKRLFEALVEFRPDFVLTINLGGMDVDGIFARLFEDLHVPYVTWFVDDPRTILMDRPIYASSHAVALTWEKSYCDYLASVGFPVVRYVPLAVDPALFNGEPVDSWDVPPTFVGNSMTAFAEREWAWVNKHPVLSAAMSEALDAGRVTRERFAAGLDSLLAADVVEHLDEDERRHAELLFFVEGTRRLRQNTVSRLEPEGLEVRGDDEWRQVTARAGGPINYKQELPGFYRRCEINLNSTSIQMATTLNQRVFDCPAAGGFLLTDAQADLFDLFDVENEIACYHSLEECIELFRWFRAHPVARQEIANRGRARILGEHTYARRLREIESVVRERFCG